MGHELMRLLVDVIGVDQDVADIVVKVVTDGPDHQARFLVNQERAFAALRAVNSGPQLEQVVQVPLQLRCAAANASGARDDGHTLWVFQLVHRFFEFCAVIALDATADATAARVIGHEHHIATGQANEGGQGCALVATFFFFHLDQQFLAFLDDVLDARLAHRYAFSKVLLGDFFEWQKAMTVFAVIYKTSFERWLDAGDYCFVDVAFALFAAFDFNFIVKQFLAVDDGQAAFFRLGCINQHPFHDAVPSRVNSSQAHDGPTMPEGTSENEGNCR